MRPKEFMIGIHNAFVHGDIIIEMSGNDFGEEDNHLEELFEGFDKSIKALEEISKLNE